MLMNVIFYEALSSLLQRCDEDVWEPRLDGTPVERQPNFDHTHSDHFPVIIEPRPARPLAESVIRERHFAP